MKRIESYLGKIILLLFTVLLIYFLSPLIKIEQLKGLNPDMIKAIGESEKDSKIKMKIKIDSIFEINLE